MRRWPGSPLPPPETMALSSTVAEFAPEALLTPVEEIGRTGVRPDQTLTAQVAERASDVLQIPPERIYAILTPPLCDRHPEAVLQWLRDTKILVHLLPELEATVTFAQEGERRHKDVWEHTKAVVRQSVPRPTVRWGAVLHDIGKVTTRRFLPDGRVTFHGHAEEGVRMFRRGVVKRIAFPPDVRKQVELLIRHHLRAGQYDGGWTDSAVRRFHRDMEPFLRDLLDLSRADVTSKRPGKRARCLRLITELAQRIERLEADDQKPKPLPAGLGNALMHGLSLPPGKHIGELRERLEVLFEAGEIEGGREPEYYLDVVRTRALLDGLTVRPPRGF
jgi:poly(A) polymerase